MYCKRKPNGFALCATERQRENDNEKNAKRSALDEL